MRRQCARIALLALLLCVAPAIAQRDPRNDPTWVRSGAPDDPAELFPRSSPLLAPFKADPMEFRSGVRIFDSSLTKTSVIATAVGVRPVMYEWTLNPEMRAQLIVCAVGLGRYDLQHSVDQICEDWHYGFLWATRYEAWSYGLFVGHISSHLGDETIERTGEKRVNYVMEEVAGYGSFDFNRKTRLYYGAGYAFSQAHVDAPWRLQLGCEHYLEERTVTGGLGPYVALDVQARQEASWTPGAQLVLGFALPGSVPDHTLDLQLVAASGTTAAREFFRSGETYLGIAFAVDL